MENNKQTFKDKVKKAMEELVKAHQHNHPLYQKTDIKESIIDENNKKAAFVLFEQIDTDRCTPESEGWLGDQYRYSIWFMEEGKNPNRLYEDHAYIRKSISGLTNSRGRDCSIKLEGIIGESIIAYISSGDTTPGKEFDKLKVKITPCGKIIRIK